MTIDLPAFDELLAAIGEPLFLATGQGEIVRANDAAARLLGLTREAVAGRRLPLPAPGQVDRRLQRVAGAAPVLLWLADHDNRGVWFNEPWLTFTGRTLEQELGSGWADGLHPDDRERCLAGCAEAFAARQPFRLEFRLRRADGSYRWMLDKAVPLFEPDGTFAGYVGSCTDVTDLVVARKHAQALEARAKFLADATEALSSSLDHEQTVGKVARLAVPVVSDMAGVYLLDDDGAIRQVTVAHVDPTKEPRLRELYGRLPVRVDDDRLLSRVVRTGRPALVSDVAAGMTAAWSGGDRQHELLEQIQFRSYLAVPLAARGRVFGAIALSTTDRRLDQADLALAVDLGRRVSAAIDNAVLFREAQEASRLKDDFLATLSHELRTPLNAVLGWARVLRDMKHDPATLDRGLAAIARNAQAQAKLVEDLLDVSRIVRGKLALRPRRVDLGAVVRAAADIVGPGAEARQISIALSLAPEPAVLLGDPDRLQQVVWNILSNAVKFSPPGSVVEVHDAIEADHAVLRVVDRGQGIRGDFLPYVFDRFRQADSSTSRQHGGLGLGLAIVKHLVELHGGSVEAHSDGEGHGATFTVRLPLRPDGAALADEARSLLSLRPPPGLPDPGLAGVRALIVAADPASRRSARAALEERGASVRSAALADEAFEAFSEQGPDVVVCDAALGPSVHALLRALRALPGRRPATIALVGADGDRKLALAAGFHACLPSPLDAEELAMVVGNLLGRRPGEG